MLDTQQGNQESMATSLGNDTRTGIHQDNRQIGCRTTRNHISGILFVPRSIGNDELTVVGTEVAISHINRNTLFTFGLQPVEQQRIIDVFAGIPDTFAVAFQRIQLVFIYFLAVKQQTAYQRRFTVIH